VCNLLILNNIDILCVSESLLKPEHQIIPIPNYNIIRCDMTGKGRGIAIIVSTKLTFKIFSLKTSDINSNNNIEHITLKIQLNKFKSFLVTCVYRHTSYDKKVRENDYKSFESLFTSLIATSNDFYILGDFNLPKHKHISPLVNIMTDLNLTQIISKPTRMKNILDLIIVNNPLSLQSHVIHPPVLSDHSLIECTINIKKPKSIKRKIIYKNYNNLDPVKFSHDLDNVLNFDFTNFNLNDTLKDLSIKLNEIVNNQVKTKIIYINDNSKRKFISTTTKVNMKLRNAAYYKFKKFPSLQNKNNFKKLKKIVKRDIIIDTKYEIEKKIQAKGLWKTINTDLNFKQKTTTSIKNITADEINSYFVGISTDSSLTTILPQKPQHLDQLQFIPTFSFIHITNEDLSNAWKRTKKPLNPSLDTMNISNLIINNSIQNPNFQLFLLNIFNKCIDEHEFPECLKISRIIPSPKNSNPKSPNELRPISIQPCVAKLFEKCLYSQLSAHFFDNNLISPMQFGFRPRHSTSHALIAITDVLYENFYKEYVSIIISLDISKCFDTICRSILYEKLKWYNIDDVLLKSYLNNRMQTVCCNNSNSRYLETTLGIPQGASLSSLLFIIMINDMPECIRNSLVILFADDSQLIINGHPENVNYLIIKIEEDLNSVFKWMESNKLKLNVDKTMMMVVAKPNILAKLPKLDIRLNNIVIKRVTTLSILGVIIDDKLLFNSQVKMVSKRCNSILSSMYPLRNILSFDSKKILINALVNPIINYASSIWLNTSKSNYKTIDKIMKRCTRFIFRMRFLDSTRNHICNKLQWLTSKYKYRFEILKHAFLFVNYQCPDYFKNYLPLNKYVQKSTRTQFRYINTSSHQEPSMKMIAAKHWLELPDVLKKDSLTFTQYKLRLYEYLLHQQTSELISNIPISYDECIDNILNV